MKFFTIAAAFIGLASFVLADEEDMPQYFTLPYEGSEFYVDDEITFITNDITNDWDESIIAKLFNADDDTEIKTIGIYTGDEIVRPDDDDDWVFTWVVDEPAGNYYIRLYEQDADGNIDDDNQDDDGEWDDENRSYDFTIIDYSQKKKRSFMKRARQLRRNAAKH